MSITICDTHLVRTVRYLSLTFEPVYSRAFFYASSGAENVLKTYFVFGALTKGFHKGQKLTFFQKFRQNSRKLTTFLVKIG